MIGSRKVAGINAIKRVGDFCIMPRDEAMGIYELACLLPGHKKPSGIIIKKVPNVVTSPQAADHVWNWDGNEDKPTLNPRIVSKERGAAWAGFLINGSFAAA